jgi:hypothetical protein
VHRPNSPASKLTLISAIVAVGTFASMAHATPVVTSVSGSVTQGGTLTIAGSGFGSKSPAQPYFWAPMNGNMNPSSLGVLQSWATTPTSEFTYTAGCGPAPGTGCAAGIPANGSSADEWAIGIYSPSYYGSGNDWNSYGQKTYVYRKSKRNFSYTNNGSTNVKLIRVWGTSSSMINYYPDFYWSVYNGRIGVEDVPQNGANDYTMPAATVTVAEGPVNQWYSEEYELASNSTATSADGDFRIAINGGPDLVSFPNTQWEQNTITMKTASGSGGDGTMKLLYPVHFLYENGGNWIPAASGSQYFTADVYADTTWARVMIGNSPTFSATTDREIQIPVQWSAGSIQVNVNVDAFPAGQKMYLFVVDSSENASVGFPITAGSSSSSTSSTTPVSPDPPSDVTVQ